MERRVGVAKWKERGWLDRQKEEMWLARKINGSWLD